MRARFSLLAALLLFSLASPAQAKPTVAVLGIEAIDDGDATALQQSGELARKLTESMRQGTASSGQYELAPGGVRDLAEMKLLSDCLDEATPCMAAIGKEVGADILLWGALEKTKDGYTLKMRAMTVMNPKAPTKSTKTLPSVSAPIAGVVGQILADLLNLPLPGAIIVTSNAEIGSVFVNGEPKGTLASGIIKIEGLAAGTVTVSIKAEGFEDAEKPVEVKAGGSSEIKIELRPTGSGPVQPIPVIGGGETTSRPGKVSRILFWSSLAVTVGGAVAFTVTGLQVKAAEDDTAAIATEWAGAGGPQYSYDNICDATDDPSVGDYGTRLKDACDKGKSMALMTNAFIGVTAVAAIASGWFYYKGFIQPNSTKETAVKTGRLQVTPVIAPGAAAINATIQF